LISPPSEKSLNQKASGVQRGELLNRHFEYRHELGRISAIKDQMRQLVWTGDITVNLELGFLSASDARGEHDGPHLLQIVIMQKWRSQIEEKKVLEPLDRSLRNVNGKTWSALRARLVEH
jgi:hypothetical protein